MKSYVNVVLVYLSIIILFTQCVVENKRENTNLKTESIIDENIYNKELKHQIFPKYQFAIKTPLILEDISSQSKNQFALQYGVVEYPNDNSKSTAYQLIVHVPPNYNFETQSSFKHSMLNSNNELKWIQTTIGEQNIEAYISSFVQNGVSAKSILIFREEYILTINVMSNLDLESKYQFVADNFLFTDTKTEQKTNQNHSQLSFNAVKYESNKFSIAYPRHYDVIEKPFPNVDVSFVTPSDGENYQANFNIVASTGKNRTLEEIIVASVKQLKELPYNYKIISNEFVQINGFRFSKIVSNAVMMGYPIISTHYTLLLDNKLYVITFSNDNNSFTKTDKQIINEIIESFKPL